MPHDFDHENDMIISSCLLSIHTLNELTFFVMKKSETEFFYHVIMSSLNHRRETKLRRNDLIDMMLDAIKSDADYDNETGDQFEKVNNVNIKLNISLCT